MKKNTATRLDLFLLGCFTIFIVWHPWFLHQRLNLFELGLYLPGIDAILQGQIPYRDFFYLRGPFELYVPACLMMIFGKTVAVLSSYFYIGTVAVLLTCVCIAWELFPSRLILYTFVPVLIARTFPRVVFTYWGGMRYALGILSILMVVKFLKTEKRGWLIAAGLLTACSGLTSMEIGFSAFAATAVILFFTANRLRNLTYYLLSAALLTAVCYVYLLLNGALADYWQAKWIVATHMTKTFIQSEPVPSTPLEVLSALIIPTTKNFRQMTPVYCYLFFGMYVFWRQRNKQLSVLDRAAGAVALYGLMLYITGFRNIWSSVFEMALQPEKIVLFYLLCQFFIEMKKRFPARKMVTVLLTAVVLSSVIYSFQRFSKRFFFFMRDPLKEEVSVVMNDARLKGMVLPQSQAEDLKQLKDFIGKNTSVHDVVWMYPELGSLHFILERPWVGKFPLATLAWMDEGMFEKYMVSLQEAKPQYLIMDKVIPDYFETYFKVPANRQKFDRQMKYIEENYELMQSTPSYNILKRAAL
jgi:hypothetical protein